MTRVEWYGDQVLARVRRAAAAAINDTMDDAVGEARSSIDRDHEARESVRVIDKAEPGDRPVGRWGSTFWRMRFLEIGTVTHTVRAKRKRVMARGGHVYGRGPITVAAQPAGNHLRGAADRTYGRLRRRLAWHFLRGR